MVVVHTAAPICSVIRDHTTIHIEGRVVIHATAVTVKTAAGDGAATATVGKIQRATVDIDYSHVSRSIFQCVSVQTKGKIPRHVDGRVNRNVVCKIHVAAVGGCILQLGLIFNSGECGGNRSIMVTHTYVRCATDTVGV